MTPVEARLRETRAWLDKAAEDIASCKALIATGHLANALFFCQQAAEKSLKGFLTWHEKPFRRTHDLEELGEACRVIDNTLAPLVAEADVLSDYAWKLRYPGAPYSPDKVEAEAMLDIAERVFEEVQSRLPGGG
jgi:HEPN domain-containing protein